MDTSAQKKWDQIYSTGQHGFFPPAMVLQMQSHLLPRQGKALDIACGLGRNAIQLCKHGLDTYAWDISGEAINRLNEYCANERLAVSTEVRDVAAHPPADTSFDVIVVSHFLDRGLIPAFVNALKQDGLIFYQTFTRTKVSDVGPSNPEYLLENGELLQLFSGLQLLFYNDNADVGNPDAGLRNEAMIVARKTG